MKRPHHRPGQAGPDAARAGVTDSVVVIGNFDGVHRGHQAVLEAVGRVARERQLAAKLLTFEPHPAVTLGREPPALLTRLARKIELCERARTQPGSAASLMPRPRMNWIMVTC